MIKIIYEADPEREADDEAEGHADMPRRGRTSYARL